MGPCLSTQRGDSSQPAKGNWLKLPPEIWLKILKRLSKEDLCQIILVCTVLHNIASDHSLWVGGDVKNVRKVKIYGLSTLFDICRFRHLKALEMSNLDLMPDQWGNSLAYLKTTNIQTLTLCFVDLSGVSKFAIANSISNLCKVVLRNSILARDQMGCILEFIAKSSVLEELDLGYTEIKTQPCSSKCANMSNQDLATLATKAVCNLKKVVMGQLEMFYSTNETILEFFRSCLLSTSLQDLYCALNVSEVPGDLLAQVMCHLKNLHLSYCRMTSDQCIAFFQLNLESSKLKHLNLQMALSHVPDFSSILLSQSVSRLEKVDFAFCYLTPEHCTSIFSACTNSSTLRSINFSYITLNEVNNIPEAVLHLQTLGLQGTSLCSSQITKILSASLKSANLEELNLWHTDLSSVPPDLLSQALCRLRKVRVGSSKHELSAKQCNKFLTSTLSYTTLEDITLYSVHLSEVLPHLIGRSISRLRRSNLEFNSLSKKQLSSILVHIKNNPQSVEEVRLSHTDMNTLRQLSFQTIPPHILSQARKKFKVSNLMNQQVVRGPDWGRVSHRSSIYNIAMGDEDGGEGGYVASTMVEFSKHDIFWSQKASGLVQVRWNNGNCSYCRMGRAGCYDIKLDPSYGNEEWLGNKI